MMNKGLRVLQIFAGLVFLSAGMYRLIFLSASMDEFQELVPWFSGLFLALTIVIECVGGVLFLAGKRVGIASFLIMGVVLSGMVRALMLGGRETWQNWRELFQMSATPTTIFLHAVYILIIVAILVGTKDVIDNYSDKE